MARFDLSWRSIDEESRPGAIQMALEEVAASRVADGGDALVRTFRWDPSTLSMGYGQSAETVDWMFCETEGIEVTRRRTGGGGIYHDHDADLSYSIVVPADAVAGDLLTAYHTLCEPVLEFFDRLGIEADYASGTHEAIYEPACFLRDIHPAHDILVAGRKICGNAQYRQQDAVIQHGSILFDRATASHLGVFDDASVSPSTFEHRTTTITDHAEVERREAVSLLADTLRTWAGADPGSWTGDELEAAATLAERKYAAAAWVGGSSGSDGMPTRTDHR